jgi:hypothetical protein
VIEIIFKRSCRQGRGFGTLPEGHLRLKWLETGARDPNTVLKLSGEAWAKVYLSAAPIDELIGGEEIDVTTGDAEKAARVLGLFDRYDPRRAVVVPPTTLVQGHV